MTLDADARSGSYRPSLWTTSVTCAPCDHGRNDLNCNYLCNSLGSQFDKCDIAHTVLISISPAIASEHGAECAFDSTLRA